MTGRRIVSIYLPQFAMERWQRVMERNGTAPPDDVALALAIEGTHGPVIHASNRAARLAGAMVGARVVDIKAICPDLHVEYSDVVGDKAALERLMLWARRWCPWTVVDGPDSLILETTGADHLLGGEAAMLVEMETRLSYLGLSAQLAVAPTWGAAWALARYGPVRAICTEDQTAAMLAPLPIDGLRLKDETLLLLRRLGLKTIGAIAQVPRLSLTRRFARKDMSVTPLMRLDQAMGHLGEPVASQDARPRIIVLTRLPEPIQDPTNYLPNLCSDLCALLARQGLGCRHLNLTVYRTDGDVSRIDAATSVATRDANHLRRLFDDKLERINPGFGFDLITLEASVVEEIALTQHRLDGSGEEGLQLPHLIDRLSAKFGSHAVKRPTLNASHIPERAEVATLALRMSKDTAPSVARERPIRLLRVPEEVCVVYAVPEGPPVQFIWRRQTHRVARFNGPERIAPEWWHDHPGTRLRDYFKVEDQGGKRLWLYREGLHEDGRGGNPRWFVHGMFS